MTTTTPSQAEAAATQANGASSDGVSVDALADGQLEVNLLDLGVSAEDIAAMRHIDTHIEEARRAQQQALEAEPSGATDDDKSEGEADHAHRSRTSRAVQQVEGGGASLQGDAGEAQCPAAAAREIAGTSTTTTAKRR